MKGTLNLLVAILMSLTTIFFWTTRGESLFTYIVSLVNIPIVALNLTAFIVQIPNWNKPKEEKKKA